jgi:hypothetical protein
MTIMERSFKIGKQTLDLSELSRNFSMRRKNVLCPCNDIGE